jgi:hypothetical protein
MIGIENKDSSFFTIESSDVSLTGTDFNKNLISLSITERSAGMPTGTLTFYDPKHIFSRILRTGVSLAISWGYRNQNADIGSLLSKKLNFDEVTGGLIRRGLKGFISSPKGKGNSSGVVTYDCNFTAYGFRGEKQSKIYDSGTKKDVISLAFNDLGVSPIKRLIDFTLGQDTVSSIKSIRQDESTFLFIQRLAKEWRALFQIGFSPAGETIALFIDPNKLNTTQYQTWALGAIGLSNIIGYKGEINNEISYSWSSNESESGVGDNVKLDIVDGKIIFRKYSAEQKKVITYRLDIEKIQDVYNDADNFDQQIKITKELLSKKDFESIKHFFIAEQSSTAPTGYGYRINCEMIGNPLVSPPNQVIINNGFPDVLGSSDSIWFFENVTHNINNSGYKMSVEIIDVFTLSPIGMAIR